MFATVISTLSLGLVSGADRSHRGVLHGRLVLLRRPPCLRHAEVVHPPAGLRNHVLAHVLCLPFSPASRLLVLQGATLASFFRVGLRLCVARRLSVWHPCLTWRSPRSCPSRPLSARRAHLHRAGSRVHRALVRCCCRSFVSEVSFSQVASVSIRATWV